MEKFNEQTRIDTFVRKLNKLSDRGYSFIPICNGFSTTTKTTGFRNKSTEIINEKTDIWPRSQKPKTTPPSKIGNNRFRARNQMRENDWSIVDDIILHMNDVNFKHPELYEYYDKCSDKDFTVATDDGPIVMYCAKADEPRIENPSDFYDYFHRIYMNHSPMFTTLEHRHTDRFDWQNLSTLIISPALFLAISLLFQDIDCVNIRQFFVHLKKHLPIFIKDWEGLIASNEHIFQKLLNTKMFNDAKRSYISVIPSIWEHKVFVNDVKKDAKEIRARLHKKIAGISIHRNNLKRSLHQNAKSHNNIRISDLEYELSLVNGNLERHQKLLSEVNLENLNIKAIPSMMTTGALEVEEILDQSQNTALAAVTADLPVEIYDSPPNMEFTQEILTDNSFSYPAMTDRWLLFKTIRLDTTIVRGQLLAQIHLPAEFVLSQWDSPNMAPFRNHEFFTGSMKLKLQWNLAKTTQFFIQFGVVYHFLQRDRKEELVNVHTISQQPGGRLNGHHANSDEIDIPFASYMPTIPIRPNNQALNLYYVTVNVMAYTTFQLVRVLPPQQT